MQDVQQEPIAIIGMGCRFPGAANPQEFWQLLREGRDAISEVPSDRWNSNDLYDADPLQPGKMISRWGGFIDQVDQFDWRAFRMLPREVKQMDPQHRLLLEVAWEALEDAGLPFEQVAGSRTGVSVGLSWSDYMRLVARNWSQLDGYTGPGNMSGFAANRISYFFDLKGPSFSLDAGCTSSLVSIYLACQSLWSGEVELAVAGGVNLMIAPESTIMVSKAGLLSPDGRCKTLDADANGFVRGEGAGLVVLKPLSHVKSSDRVYALIRGIAANHNGHNEWIIASSQAAQEELLRDAYGKAGIDPAEIDYVELHGTGFLRGDPIEAKALGMSLRAGSERERPCLVGSVKTNIGHLESAAGIASVIKVALSLYHKEIPPTLNLQTVNPDISFQDLRLAAAQATTPWPDRGKSALAGVTSLSLTGANAHAILEAAGALPRDEDAPQQDQRAYLLPLSARSENALSAQAALFREFLHAQEGRTIASWQDICYTASVRRTHHEHRLAVVGHSREEIVKALDALMQTPSPIDEQATKHSVTQPQKLVFLYAHQISPWVLASIKELSAQAAFQAMVDACEPIFHEYTGKSIWEEIHSIFSHQGRTPLSPQLCFTLQVALTELWRSRGIIPDAVLAEGFGELSAAYVVGALTLEDAIRLLSSHIKQSAGENAYRMFSAMPQQQPVKIPVYSTTAGLIVEQEQLVSSHWKTYLSQPELTTLAVEQLLAANYDTFIEIGPPSILSGAVFARLQHLNQTGRILSSLRQDKEASIVLLEALGVLYTSGYTINWSALFSEQCRCTELPTYSWQREKLWPSWLDVETISSPPEQGSGHEDVDFTRDQKIADELREETLTALWADVLGLEQVKCEDNFFELGGHSLLATQLLARISDRFQIALTLSDLLQFPTPAACTAFMKKSKEVATNAPVGVQELPSLIPDTEQRYEPFPTTDVQQVYWVGRNAVFELGNVGNHGYIEVEAEGLNIERLTLSVRTLIERHEMLRTVLLPDGQQQILEHVPPFQVKVVDLRGCTESIVESALAEMRQSLDHQILPLDQCPTFAIYVSRLSDYRVRLHLSIESVFVDAWSMNVLIQEFIHLYHEPGVSLPPLELSFRDYVLAERTLQDSELYHRSREYWLNRLPSLFPAPLLPLAQDPSGLTHPRFVHRGATLNVESWGHLKVRAARAGLTPSGVLLAAFAQVLSMWSKSPCFSINLSLFNRLPLHSEVNTIVGDFTSLIVLAIDNSAADSFEQRAQRVQAQLWNDLDHSSYSGVHVLRELARLQSGAAKIVMPVVFTSLLIQDTASPYPSPWQETIYCVSQTPQVWLDHQVHETRGALVLHWQSVDALFPAGLLDSMFESYCQFLHRLATDEACWHETIAQLLPPAQLAQRALVNATTAPVSDKLLQSFFVEEAHKRPQQAAVISSRRTVTYEEVYSGSNQLAHQLRQAGALPNRLVGVVMEKGYEQVLAVLGILQAGAAYLPIDPELPYERLAYLLEHGEVEIVLTQSWLAAKVRWPEGIQRIYVDTLDLQKKDIPALEQVQKPEDLAYVIYTSGSTGLPKGVMIDHRGAVNTILDINQRFGMSCHDRVFALSSLNFDLSVYDIFGTLAAGATIVMAKPGTMRNPSAWLEMLVRERVTVWNSVPALLQMLVEFTQSDPELLSRSCLRLALLSGDWIPLSLPERLKQLVPALEVISMGGATEASIWSIIYPITSIQPAWKSIPYGQPMLNQGFAVLNEMLEPCPVWVSGQLYVSGIGLAKGYWRDEEKTKASFFLHPRTGERLYRTGDLGRYLPDGNIEFLGREDFQVKIQGHRIELGEIEETLLTYPLVQAATANVLVDPQGNKRLVAYVVLQNEQQTPANGSSFGALQLSSDEVDSGYSLELLRKQPSLSGQGAAFSSNGSAERKSSYHEIQRLEGGFGQSRVRKEGSMVIELPPVIIDADRLKRYRERLSARKFLQEVIPFGQFSDFLGTLQSIEMEGLPKYLYPSAGGIYPVQMYLYVQPKRVEGISEGIYSYNPQKHQLVMLAGEISLDRSIHAAINRPVFDGSAFSIFLIGQLDHISAHYGEAAKDFCLLEAGYISQLLMTRASEYSIGLCPIGGIDFASIRDLFSLQESHVLLHSLIGGRLDPITSTGWSLLLESSNVVPVSQASTMDTTLRKFLLEKLPEYMVPTAIMVLDALPLTANGKVERKNLPIPTLMSGEQKAAYVAPSSTIERAIAAVWEEVLLNKKVGIHDKFFDLGGNSLQMITTYNQLCEIFGYDMPLIDVFFTYPTISSLAEFLRQKQQPQSPAQDDLDDRYELAEGHKEFMEQQRQARLMHRDAERNEDA